MNALLVATAGWSPSEFVGGPCSAASRTASWAVAARAGLACGHIRWLDHHFVHDCATLIVCLVRADDIGDIDDNGMAAVDELEAAHYAAQVRVVYVLHICICVPQLIAQRNLYLSSATRRVCLCAQFTL